MCPCAESGYDALLAGSYEQYVRNLQAAPEWEAEQMEQARSFFRCGCGCLLVSCAYESNQSAPEWEPELNKGGPTTCTTRAWAIQKQAIAFTASLTD